MTSEWRHRNKTHSRYSELNSLQNVYFGFFIFGNLTEWRCFVTFLSNDPRIMCTELWKLVVIHRLSLWLLSVAHHRVKVGLWWLLTDWRINYCSDITIPGIGFFCYCTWFLSPFTGSLAPYHGIPALYTLYSWQWVGKHHWFYCYIVSYAIVNSECPNYDMIIPLLLTEKLEDLPNKCKLTPGKCLR